MANSKRALLVVCTTIPAIAGLIGASVPSAYAEEAPSDQLSEIVVTAEKRTEDVKDVPASISVLSGADLLDHNVTTIEDLTRSTPSISFNAGGSGIGVGVGETNIEIRGISSSSGASTAGVYFDDVAVNVDNKNGVGAPAPMMLDLNRVEILRGPQGTLFGASSEGGAVRYIFNPAKLDDFSAETSGEVGGTYHGGVNYKGTGIVNIPVINDVLAVRLSVGYSEQSGWINNYNFTGDLLHQGVNDYSTTFVRASALFKPTDSITITPQVIFQEIRSSDTPVFYLQDYAYFEANSCCVPPPLPTDGLYNQHKQVAEPSNDKVVIPSLTAAFNFGWADLTSVSSYYYRPYDRTTDGTTFDSYIIAVDFLGRPPTDRAIATLPSPVYQPVTYRTFAQELRLSSPEPQGEQNKLRWLGGLYYNDQSAAYSNNDFIPGLSSTFQDIYGYGINSPQSPISDPSVPNLYANDAVYLESGRYDTKQTAAFGQLDYLVLPELHASAGIRFTHASVSTQVNQFGFYAIGNFAPFSKSDDFNSTTPKFSLVYDVTDDATIYTSVGKGFRLGGELYTPLPVGSNNVCAGDYKTFGLSDYPSSSYGSDSLWSYELGSKGRALGNSLSFNVAGYYVNWHNLQQAIYLPTCGYYDTVNIGNAESYGSELELHYKPEFLRGITVALSGDVNHATLTSSTNLLTAMPGQHIPYSPEWTADISIDYSHPFGASQRVFVSWDYDYTGPSYGTYQTTSPNYHNPSYGVMNLTIGFDHNDWQVALFSSNLLNDQTIIQSPTINALVEGYAVRPFTAGLRVTKKF